MKIECEGSELPSVDVRSLNPGTVFRAKRTALAANQPRAEEANRASVFIVARFLYGGLYAVDLSNGCETSVSATWENVELLPDARLVCK